MLEPAIIEFNFTCKILMSVTKEEWVFLTYIVQWLPSQLQWFYIHQLQASTQNWCPSLKLMMILAASCCQQHEQLLLHQHSEAIYFSPEIKSVIKLRTFSGTPSSLKNWSDEPKFSGRPTMKLKNKQHRNMLRDESFK